MHILQSKKKTSEIFAQNYFKLCLSQTGTKNATHVYVLFIYLKKMFLK